MRRLLRVVLLVPALGLLPLGCGPSAARPSDAPTTPATAPAPKRADTMPQHAAEEKQITIDNFSFDPPELTVPAGTRVTWLNRDDVPHTATSTTKPRAFDSGTLDTDQKYSFVFTTAGVYEYFCAVHPKMTGRITVK